MPIPAKWMVQKNRRPDLWSSVFLLPVGFNRVSVEQEYERLVENGDIEPIESFNPEHILAWVDLIARNVITNNFNSSSYVSQSHSVNSSRLKSEVNSRYTRYRPFISVVGDIRVDDSYQVSKLAKRYSLDPAITKPFDQLQFIEISDPSILKRLSKKKEDELESINRDTKEPHRWQLVQDALLIGQQLELRDVRALLENDTNPKSFDSFYHLTNLHSGYYYGNTKDESGHRFHSPWTNTNSVVRSAITINNEDVVELDLKNSQFFFLANLANTEVISLLESEWHHLLPLTEIQSIYADLMQNDDFVDFLQLAREGRLYEEFQTRLKIRERHTAKEMVIRYMFSNSGQFRWDERRFRRAGFPSLVEFRNRLNFDGLKTIPTMLQRIEAYVIIDCIVPRIYERDLAPIVTVHDSIICRRSVSNNVRGIMLDVFDELGFSEPIIVG